MRTEWDHADESGSLGNPGPSWHASGTGDYFSGSTSQILCQSSSGDVIWKLHGTSVIGSLDLGNRGTTWHV